MLSYGFAESNDIVCMHPDVKGIQSDFIVRFEDGTEHAVEIKSNPGRHNMLNATAVLTVAHVLGLDIDAAAKALSSFEGVRRRFTHVGDIDGITVVDDYGHHPTEIKATLAAASSLGYKHVDVVFQPHRYSRLPNLNAIPSRILSLSGMLDRPVVRSSARSSVIVRPQKSPRVPR